MLTIEIIGICQINFTSVIIPDEDKIKEKDLLQHVLLLMDTVKITKFLPF